MMVFLVAVFSILLIFILWLLLVCPADLSPEQMEPFLGHGFAHRGLSDPDNGIPENSLSAFRRAISLGYGIELDAALSADRELVVFRDETLERMCGTVERLDSMQTTELTKLRLRGSGETIPLLSDVLALTAGQVPLLIHLRHTADDRAMLEKLRSLLSSYDGPCCALSEDAHILKKLRHKMPELLRAQLAGSPSAGQKPFAAFLSKHLLLNILSRPHFIAMEKTNTREPSFRAAVRFLHAVPILWTTSCEEEYYAHFDKGTDVQIFEGFLPPAILLAGDAPEPQEAAAPDDEDRENMDSEE